MKIRLPRTDLLLHFFGGMFIATVVGKMQGPVAGYAAGLTAGYAKERLGNRQWDDLDYTAAGAAVGAFLSAL